MRFFVFFGVGGGVVWFSLVFIVGQLSNSWSFPLFQCGDHEPSEKCHIATCMHIIMPNLDDDEPVGCDWAYGCSF